MKRAPVFVNDDYFVDAVVGYRAWFPVVHDGLVTLSSISYNVSWEPGKDMRADCVWRAFHKHTPPGRMCDCGIWAYDDLETLRRFSGDAPGLVHGEVHLWGDLVRHKTGYRAEFARVASIIEPKTAVGRGSAHHDIARRVADRYDVPFVLREKATT